MPANKKKHSYNAQIDEQIDELKNKLKELEQKKDYKKVEVKVCGAKTEKVTSKETARAVTYSKEDLFDILLAKTEDLKLLLIELQVRKEEEVK